jgi:serine protease inhibitor
MVSPQPNSQGVYVSDARHKTYVEVNEDGSEAAASTTIVVFRSLVFPSIYAYVQGVVFFCPYTHMLFF